MGDYQLVIRPDPPAIECGGVGPSTFLASAIDATFYSAHDSPVGNPCPSNLSFAICATCWLRPTRKNPAINWRVLPRARSENAWRRNASSRASLLGELSR